ncbi:MAG: DUF2336 domain-containing protein [Alphaproteobacteria bacterium]|nr:MAG: DUF2336 domain-containing protein [Alphaproteobacteria bacterium]
MAITYDDINKLVREPSSQVRATIAQKVAESYNHSTFTPKANKLAIDIFRLLMRDTALQVRKVLAESLKDNMNAPHDIVLSLAYDDYEVAEDILKSSKVLTEHDLLELVRVNDDVKKLVAISQRERVPPTISSALIQTNTPIVIQSVLHNSNAEINEQSYFHISQTFADHDFIIEALVCRGDLSFTLAETLYALVAERLKNHITKRHLLPKKMVERMSSVSREVAILNFLTPWMSDEEIVTLVQQMASRKRLTNSIIVRALCLGEVAFFEIAMAERASIPIQNARKLLNDPGKSGFNALYKSSHLPAMYMDALYVTLKLVREEIRKPQKLQPKNFCQTLIHNIEAHQYHQSIQGMSQLIQFLQKPTEFSI